MGHLLQRVNTAISIAILSACSVALLLFGWSITGWKAMAIPTGSMRPSIPPGSLVLTHRVPAATLKVGDVITHTNPFNPKMTITHRIIRITKLDGIIPVFTTKGDANKVADIPVTGNDVVGKVVWHVPDAGWVLLKAKNPWIILPFVYAAALLIMIEEVIRLRDYLKFCIPYCAPGFSRRVKESGILSRRLSQGAAFTTAFIFIGIMTGPSALAILRTNTVALVKNTISVVAKPTNTTTCNTNINNSTTQNGQSGNVTDTGNKGTTGNISSGNVSNTNTTTITINQNNGC